MTEPQEQRTVLDGLLGTFFLLGYLGLDGLTSTTRTFIAPAFYYSFSNGRLNDFSSRFLSQRNASSARILTRQTPSEMTAPCWTRWYVPSDTVKSYRLILALQVWVNLFASVISAIGAAVSFPLSIHSLGLILTNWRLAADILILSATAAVGLIVLLNTIAAFGALTSSTIMTVRQFLSILLNAGVFGNFASVGTQGWLGVGWVASGIYIKMDSSWDPPKPPKQNAGAKGDVASPLNDVGASSSNDRPQFDAEKEGLLPEYRDQNTPLFDRDGPEIEVHQPPPPPPLAKPVKFQWARQYGPPILVPVILAGLFTLFWPSNASGDNQPPVPPQPVTPGQPINAAPIGAESDSEPEKYVDETAGYVAEEVPEIPQVAVEGGRWANELHATVSAECPHEAPETQFFPSDILSTALATFPRSGNSYIRSLVERATGYRTSSVYW